MSCIVLLLVPLSLHKIYLGTPKSCTKILFSLGSFPYLAKLNCEPILKKHTDHGFSFASSSGGKVFKSSISVGIQFRPGYHNSISVIWVNSLRREATIAAFVAKALLGVGRRAMRGLTLKVTIWSSI
ncbi:hypothetical protein F4679DRAFT_562286 [Xylaria curta]|nr:hypothetical protein F4679DRAFT_562286 [Xylaria curta]